MKTFLLVLLLMFPSVCFADIFEYTGSDGVVHFTDDASKVPKAKKRNVMKGTAAPFTEDAQSKIRHEFSVSEKTGKTPSGKKMEKIDESDPTRAGKIFLDYCREIYSAAGYDFDLTIRAVAHYLQQHSNDQQSVQIVLNDHELLKTPFQSTLECLWIITGSGPEHYSGYFDVQTLQSADYIYNTVVKNIRF